MTKEFLLKHGVKPSVQRIAVMEYLMEHNTHPTVETIYEELVKKIPTLSKTTIYSTLKLLTEQDAARQLTIDERKVCFDANTSIHAHFLCKHCGKIYDVKLLKLHPEDDVEIPKGFSVEQSEIYLRGCCKECLEKK